LSAALAFAARIATTIGKTNFARSIDDARE
jgi:hypothetical protein